MNDNVDFDALNDDEIWYYFSVRQLNEDLPIRIVIPCPLRVNKAFKVSHSRYSFTSDYFKAVTDFIELAIKNNPDYANIWITFAEFLNNLKPMTKSFEVRSKIHALHRVTNEFIELPPIHRDISSYPRYLITGLQFVLSCRQEEYTEGPEPNVPVYSFDYTVAIQNSTGE